MKDNNALLPLQELQLIYKTKYKPSERPVVTSSADSYKVLLSIWDKGLIGFLEQFKILLLNRANRVLGYYEVSTGGIAGTLCDPKVVFAVAIKCCATSIILAHNHPSGNLKPSTSDVQLTNKIKQGGQLLDIAVLDHIILSTEGYYSFTDEGLM